MFMYVNLITRQSFDFSTPIPCEAIPRNIIVVDPGANNEDFSILRPEPMKRKPPLIITPTHLKSKRRPNNFTALDAGIYSNAQLDQFRYRILYRNHSDTTLPLLGKALGYSFMSAITVDYYDSHISQPNPYITLLIGLHDKLLNLTPIFTPTWFADAFIALFGYPCYILTQCGIYFSTTLLFIQALLTLFIKVYKTIIIKQNLQQNITIVNSIAHGFFNILAAEMVNGGRSCKKNEL